MSRYLSKMQVDDYRRLGYLQPVALLDEPRATALRAAVIDHLAVDSTAERYELTDDVKVGISSRTGDNVAYVYLDEKPTVPHTLPFLFNIWRTDERFREVAFDVRIAGMACELLGSDEVLLMEDNVVVKMPGSGVVPWHQDLSYWPVQDPALVTVWIALDAVDALNGAMRVIPHTQHTPEHLPVQFRDAATFMGEFRPGVPVLPQNPESEGRAVVEYKMSPGEGGFHHPLTWHGSTPNTSAAARCAYVIRYIASGTVWYGSTRVPYEDVGCQVGDALTSQHLPLAYSAR